MAFYVPETVRRVWDEWNLRGAVLCSLFFQVVLIILANSRRNRGGGMIGAIIWSSYLLADWIATFAVGLISSGITDVNCSGSGKAAAMNNQLAAFWAPFLLLHLGGPDGITAFSLEDNELWIRHLLGLVFQVVAVVYVFLQSMSLENEYWIPTVLVFFAGTCKYAERTLSLYKACLGNFKRSLLRKPDPGPNYPLLVEYLSTLNASHMPVTIYIEEDTERRPDGHTSSYCEPIWDPLRIVKEGHRFFETFKALVVDHMFSFRDRVESQSFFFAREADDAFRVMEVELNFLYDVLHTKAPIVHCRFGYLCRFICTALLVACFPLLPQHNVFPCDKIITYVLLGGAVAFEVVSVFNLMLSDWALVSAGKVVSRVLIKFQSCRTERRWSNTMGQHSFISFCLKEDGRFMKCLNKVAHLIGGNESLDEFRYKKEKACEKMLKEFVFDELKAKALKAASTKDANGIYSARVDHSEHPSAEASLSDEVEYDENLLTWHIATELCYFVSNCTNQDGGPKKDCRDLCKLLSDYMLYLLVMRPTLMSTVAGIAHIRFQDTCAEAKIFFKNRESEFTEPRGACEMLFEMEMPLVKPNQIKGDRSKSVLFDACILAQDLMKLDEDRRWEMMSRIWVELLSYAASRCRPTDHARQLTQGGEFITFVWLLMVHLGLAEQFRAGDARATLLVKSPS